MNAVACTTRQASRLEDGAGFDRMSIAARRKRDCKKNQSQLKESLQSWCDSKTQEWSASVFSRKKKERETKADRQTHRQTESEKNRAVGRSRHIDRQITADRQTAGLSDCHKETKSQRRGYINTLVSDGALLCR